MPEFREFGKIPRLSREATISEKLDGTNACIHITEDGQFLTGSRQRWITPEDDNFGFSKWAHDHEEELRELGPGSHFGEYWGRGTVSMTTNPRMLIPGRNANHKELSNVNHRSYGLVGDGMVPRRVMPELRGEYQDDQRNHSGTTRRSSPGSRGGVSPG